MNFYNLKCFLVLGKHMHFGKAAEELFVSEQALSSMISRMEKECGTALLERSPRLKLTPAGEVLTQKASRILALNAEMQDEISDVLAETGGPMAIGITRARSRIMLPLILPAFIAANPRVRLSVHIGNSDEMLPLLLSDKLSLMISTCTQPVPGIHQEKILSERLVVLVPRTLYHALYPEVPPTEDARNLPFSLERFSNERFLIFEGSLLNELTMQYLNWNKVMPNKLLSIGDSEMLLQLSSQGLGLAVAFEHFTACSGEPPDKSNLYVFPVYEPNNTVDVAVSYRQDRYLNKLTRSFLSITKECVRNLQ